MLHAAPPAWSLLAYLVSGICFILALRGLSSPSTSRTGNRMGMFGMLLAVVTTLMLKAPVPDGSFLPAPSPEDVQTLLLILGAIAIGGAIGLVTARRIQMTDMPQLVAAFHSLVGLAAVLVGWAAFSTRWLSGSLARTGRSTRFPASKWGLAWRLARSPFRAV